ncbi:MAG: LEA type 2 family protein [Chitinophagaceae bacterium]|nr:LEA type 2 family protein [Chitinophagaceae bacterium]
MGFSSSQLSIDLLFYNPNNFGLELNNTDLDIYVDGNFLGHSTQNLQVAIPRKDVFILPLKMDIDMKNLLKNGITALLNKSVTIRLLGKIKISKAGVRKSFPVDYQTIQQFSM